MVAAQAAATGDMAQPLYNVVSHNAFEFLSTLDLIHLKIYKGTYEKRPTFLKFNPRTTQMSGQQP